MKQRKIKLIFFFRKKTPEFNSIETIFSGLIKELYIVIRPSIVHCTYSRANLVGIIKNSFLAYKYRKGIVHVTGHVNYLSIFTSKNTILSIHDVGSYKEMNWLKSKLFIFFWFQAPIFFSKRVIVISEFTRQEVLKIYPIGKNKIKVIPNPVNKQFLRVPYSFNLSMPKILLVGTKFNKNLKRIIAAVEGVSCELFILGKLNEDTIHLLEEKEIKFDYKFNLSFVEVFRIYSESDFLCFCSIYEGFGLPILEAQATCRPVITSNLGAMKEVTGQSACLVDPYDVDSIRAGIEKIILDTEYREKLIEKGFENIKKFSIDKIANQYYSLYKEIDEN